MNKLTMSGSVGLAALVTAGLMAWQAPSAFSRIDDIAGSSVVQHGGADDGAHHDRGDDHGHHRAHGTDDGPNHDLGDDHGGHRGGGDD